jgi:uncharacterized membrane protein YdbT with pleckstrin-like domain
MSYIDRNLLPDEKIIFRTRKNFIIFYVSIIYTIIALILCLDIPFIQNINANINAFTHQLPVLNKIHNLPALFFFLVAVYGAIRPLILYLTGDYVVTNKRIVMREGFFERRLSDVRLTTVANVNVEQGPLGQMLNFGDIGINSFGGAADYFSQIDKPVALQKAVHSQLDSMKPQGPTGT